MRPRKTKISQPPHSRSLIRIFIVCMKKLASLAIQKAPSEVVRRQISTIAVAYVQKTLFRLLCPSCLWFPQETVHSILTEGLDMRKLSARLVPRLLTVDQSTQERTCRVLIWTLLRQILTSFCWDVCLWMKHGSIISPQNPNNSLNNGTNDCSFELIQYPPYSPDLTPSDFIYSQTWQRSFLVPIF